ncbi:MAG: class I SAM-dependent methyltransferase [Dehalococcoidia bacterium]
MAGPKLYGKLAPWFHLLTAPEDYDEEAALYSRALIDACDEPPKTVLELGSGGGNNASHMKTRFELTLVDLSPRMLALSRTLNPECEHRRGDMRTVRLGRQFDAVFVHDAVAYITTEDDLRATMETAFVHCRTGGAALFVPDCVRETFRPATEHGGHDSAPSPGRVPVRGRALRYVSWVHDPDPDDTTYTVDFAYLLRDADGSVRVERDRHVCGVFPRATWRRLLRDAGFTAKRLALPHSEVGTIDVLVGKKKA